MTIWTPITPTHLPPEGKVVLTKIDDARGCRNEARLIRSRGLWWFPDMSMYVYYAPTHWAWLEYDEEDAT